ncbi:succinylglutamate desuccinylase/aspartoacylase family protein [Patescibacteria group bacterium]|nr:succinylglutamate desuccinylase/aspartoacylase family protein [Patescibacteria group bacterium]MBU2613281.1 succinylglutamate desuccinylase/aspartoacylase family protein [Patescibacteria group bacterium]
MKDLRAACNMRGVEPEHIGHAGRSRSYDLFKVTLNPRRKRAVCFVCGVHGNETSGPASAIEFLRTYRSEPSHPRIIILPNANPSGYDRDTYRNDRNLNPNRHFSDRPLTGEVAALYRAIAHEPLEAFASFHEDDVKKGSYLYGFARPAADPELFRTLIRAASRHGPICTDTRIYRRRAEKGVIGRPVADGSFEWRMHDDGVPYAICMEVPDVLSMRNCIRINVGVMEAMVRWWSM